MARRRTKKSEPTVADRVRDLLVLTGASQKQFNRTARLGKGHMSHILSGSRRFPRERTLERIVVAFRHYGVDVTSEYLRWGLGNAPRRIAS